MRFALVSDLHLEFKWSWDYFNDWQKLADKINAIGIGNSVDVVINAGDIHPTPACRDRFHSLITVPYEHILGNHDFYNGQIIRHSRFVKEYAGVKIVGATLWTDFKANDAMLRIIFPRMLADGHQIQRSSTSYARLADEIYAMHVADLHFIETEKPDVVITHHAPSLLSVNSKYMNTGDMNYYFASDLDMFILGNPNIKVWCHGHMHDSCSYKIGETRIVANPLAYPRETHSEVDKYIPLVVEVN